MATFGARALVPGVVAVADLEVSELLVSDAQVGGCGVGPLVVDLNHSGAIPCRAAGRMWAVVALAEGAKRLPYLLSELLPGDRRTEPLRGPHFELARVGLGALGWYVGHDAFFRVRAGLGLAVMGASRWRSVVALVALSPTLRQGHDGAPEGLPVGDEHRLGRTRRVVVQGGGVRARRSEPAEERRVERRDSGRGLDVEQVLDDLEHPGNSPSWSR